MPRLIVDGCEVEVTAGSNVLAALRKLGLEVPALCYLPGCTPNTACMACVVRLAEGGRIVPSCATPATEGLRVESETAEIRDLRRTALELMLSDHAGARWGPVEADGRRHVLCDCGMGESCRLRKYAEIYEADPERYRGATAGRGTTPTGSEAERSRTGHPEIEYYPERCILCGLCVQLAQEAGEPLGLTFLGRGFDTRVAIPFDESLAAALQTSGVRCAGACPTGALVRRTRPQ